MRCRLIVNDRPAGQAGVSPQAFCKLKHLRVVLQSDVCDRAYTTMINWDEFLKTVHGDTFDFSGTSESLARSLLSLRYVFLATRGEYPSVEDTGSSSLQHGSWDVSHGWCVAGLGRGTCQIPLEDGGLVELREDVMDTVVRREELVLSDNEEVSTAFAHPRVVANRDCGSRFADFAAKASAL